MSTPPTGETVFRFPYPRIMVVGLMAIVLFAFGHSVNTYRLVRELTAEGRVLAEDPWPWVQWMLGVSVGLALFVASALLRRRALRLTVGPEGMTLEKLALSPARRRRTISWDDVRKASVERGLGQGWTLRITPAQRPAIRLPLAHAVAAGADAGAPSAAIGVHPLVRALREALGAKLSVMG